MIDCWLAKTRYIWTSAAFGRTFAVDSSSEGSFSVCPAEDFADLDLACVAVLSNLGPEVNSSRVLVVVGGGWDLLGCRSWIGHLSGDKCSLKIKNNIICHQS